MSSVVIVRDLRVERTGDTTFRVTAVFEDEASGHGISREVEVERGIDLRYNRDRDTVRRAGWDEIREDGRFLLDEDTAYSR